LGICGANSQTAKNAPNFRITNDILNSILEPVQYLENPWARARDCSGNPFGATKRLKRKARFAAFYATNAPEGSRFPIGIGL
jgi:hypothetical protein